MPEEINQEKAEKYKNRWVSKCLEKNPIKEIEQLPDDLKRLWSKGKYKEFLESALEKLERLKTLQEVCKTLNLSDEQEVREHLQDIDYTVKKFKKYFRVQHNYKGKEQLSRAVKKHLTYLKELLKKGLELKQILKKALRKLAGRHLKLSKCLWAICPTLGLSNEKKVHELVQRFYCYERGYYCDYQEIEDVRRSRYAYITNTETIELLPHDWLRKWGKEKQKARISEKNSLAMLKKRLRVTDNQRACDVTQLTFKVESELKRKLQKTPELQDGSLLLKAAEEFLSSFEIWLKLDDQFPSKLLGVYFLYYIGKKKLHPESFVRGSLSVPVYVGMSAFDISRRLRDHRAKIGRAKDLDVADFAVKVMFVDNRHYAHCIEGMFIEDFVPVWNRETLGISFGSQKNSLWEKYHVDKDPDVCNDMERKLNINGGHSESESESDEWQSESESAS